MNKLLCKLKRKKYKKMKLVHLKKILPLIVLSALLLTNCDDKWDEHYNQDTFDIPDYSLSEYIAQTPELSIFYHMLKQTGYDIILASLQSYTVWVPINNALTGIDTTNKELVKQIVENHITRGRITTSGVENERVKMLSGKLIDFERNGSNILFGNNTILEANIYTKNGLIHTIDGYAPYLNNLWEFIGVHENFDSLSAFIYGETKKIFDPVNSIEIYRNDTTGEVIYDSAYKTSNLFLEEVGSIDNEDSTYTALLPDNTAWTEAYTNIEKYFNFPDNGGGEKRKRSMTQYTLVNDMLYRGLFENPASMSEITSTGGHTFQNPGFIFNNTYETTVLSNGIAHITGQMPKLDTSSWFKEIRIEAEDQDGRINHNNIIFSRTSYGSGLKVSDDKYILADPTAAESSVEFEIPNTLSATYNIYCVFVPATIVDATDTIPTKVRFVLTFIRRISGSTFITRITPEVNTTSATGVTKMLVDQFEFDYANIIDEDYDEVAVKLEVINDVTSDEEHEGSFSRTMRIDCIILEPVFE